MLAAYLVMLLPFVLLLTSLYRIKGLGYLTGVITLLSFSIIVVQGARIGIIALVPLLLYCFIWHMGIRAKLQTLAFIALAVFIFFTMFTMTSKFVLKTFQTQTSSINSDAGSIHMSSIKIRKQLIDESIDIATSHAFMGAGGGNFEDQMNSDRMFRTAWISNSHNYLMELLGNWGIIIFFGFMILYMDWLIRLWYLFRHAPAPDKYRYLMYLLALLMYLPASILPSSIRRDYLVWVFFAAVNAVAYETINTKELS
ncbi:MAG: O-antigen ligase family protein [Candidatus Cloacimonadaceae bacterium]|nr:O-antigen ligase family protein [Candidatus Cloacimonadaceae bacterium]